MLYRQITRNRWMTVALFVAAAVLLAGVSLALDVLFFGTGLAGSLIFAGVVFVVVLLVAWFLADRVVLSAVGARPPREDDPNEANLPEIVEGLALAAGMPTPKVYVIDDRAPNALATGRSPERGAVAFTTGLLQRMNRHQVEAVAAHELSHVANRDALVGVVAAVLVGAILILSRMALYMLIFGGGRRGGRRGGGGGGPAMLIGLVVLVLAPIFALLLRFAISRRRESLADASAVELTRNPEAMIGALEVLAGDHSSVDFQHGFAAHLWIEEPEDPKESEESGPSFLQRIFATHPPISERIEELRAIAGDQRFR